MGDRAQRGSRPTETGLPGAIPPAPMPGATFRHLQLQGLSAGEAASLTVFMCGMPAADLRRSLMQINRVLFQQRLYQLGRFGIGEGERIRPH